MAAGAEARGGPLAGARILVVEDEYLLAGELAEGLAAAGAEVLGPVASLGAAFALVAEAGWPDAAVLDVNLGGVPVFPLADALLARGVRRLVLATGYDRAALPPALAALPRCAKPFRLEEVVEALRRGA